MRCPKCNSDDCTKFSLVYLNGISDIRTKSRGRGFDFGEMAGAFSFRSRARGTVQTRLSKIAGPPRKLPYRHVLFGWGLGLSILYWLFGYLVWLHEISAVRSVALFPQYAHAYSGLALFVLASLWWYNHQVSPQVFRRWECSFTCERCGSTFQPSEQQEAA
jgi:hypothetical protein